MDKKKPSFMDRIKEGFQTMEDRAGANKKPTNLRPISIYEILKKKKKKNEDE